MAKARGDGDAWRSAWGIGFNFAAAVAGFLFIGYAIDRFYGTTPWGILIGTFVGLIGGMYNMIRQALAAARRSGQADETTESITQKRGS